MGVGAKKSQAKAKTATKKQTSSKAPKAATIGRSVVSGAANIFSGGAATTGRSSQIRASGGGGGGFGRRHRKHGTMWYLREVQRMRAKKKYERIKYGGR